MKEIICWLLGHKAKVGPLMRSPNTAFTHWREIDCERCGAPLANKKEYHDALTEPELFRQ